MHIVHPLSSNVCENGPGLVGQKPNSEIISLRKSHNDFARLGKKDFQSFHIIRLSHSQQSDIKRFLYIAQIPTLPVRFLQACRSLLLIIIHYYSQLDDKLL